MVWPERARPRRGNLLQKHEAENKDLVVELSGRVVVFLNVFLEQGKCIRVSVGNLKSLFIYRPVVLSLY